ncbi:MAG: hypothetical protein ACI3ZQ_06045 [Candidatus Cryptobacteroides sp.]
MEFKKYCVYVDNNIVAENMDIDVAIILVKALFEKYYDDCTITVSVREMDRVTEG